MPVRVYIAATGLCQRVGNQGKVCTQDWKPLAQNVSMSVVSSIPIIRVEGPPDPDRPGYFAVQEGEAIQLTIKLSAPAPWPFWFGVRTADGTALEVEDYIFLHENIHFARGQSQTTITVQTTNDTVDDSGEVFEGTLVEGMESDRSSLKQAVFKTGPGATLEYTTRRVRYPVTILNETPLPKLYLSEFGKAVSGHILQSLSDRMRAEKDSAGDTITPNGEDALPSFSITNANLGAWASGSSRPMHRDELSGSTDHYTVGADVRHGDWLAGVGVTRSSGEGTYEQMELSSDLTTANPYVAWLDDALSAWATAGVGTGSMEMTDTRYDKRYPGIDLSYRMFAGGVDRAFDGETIRWNVGAEGVWSRLESEHTTYADGHVLGAKAENTSLEAYAAATYKLSEVVEPFIEWAIVHERAEYDESTSLRVGAGVVLSGQSLSGQAQVERLLANDAEWVLSGNVAYAPQETGPYANLGADVKSTPADELYGGEGEVVSLRMETGWHRKSRLSPYIAWADGRREIGQRLDIGERIGIDMSVTDAEDTELRMSARISW